MRTSHSTNWRTWLIRPALVAGVLSASCSGWVWWRGRRERVRAAAPSRLDMAIMLGSKSAARSLLNLPPLYDDNFWFNQCQDTQARASGKPRQRMSADTLTMDRGSIEEVLRKADEIEPVESEWWRRPLSTDPARPWRNPR